MLNLSFSIYDLETFLFILTRVSCFIFVAPFFSLNHTPTRMRVGLSIFISILLYQVLTPREAIVCDTVLEYAFIVCKEAITGLLIGFAANMCSSIVNFAGSISDMETGLSMATLMDPITRQQSSITGVLYQNVCMLMLIASGMYRYLLKALADTFSWIPLGGAGFHSDLLLDAMVDFLSEYIVIGFRICLPVFCIMLLLNAILGVMAKISPQMNMFSVGIQLKVLVGLGTLFLTSSILGSTADFIFQEMQNLMNAFLEALR